MFSAVLHDNALYFFHALTIEIYSALILLYTFSFLSFSSGLFWHISPELLERPTTNTLAQLYTVYTSQYIESSTTPILNYTAHIRQILDIRNKE